MRNAPQWSKRARCRWHGAWCMPCCCMPCWRHAVLASCRAAACRAAAWCAAQRRAHRSDAYTRMTARSVLADRRSAARTRRSLGGVPQEPACSTPGVPSDPPCSTLGYRLGVRSLQHAACGGQQHATGNRPTCNARGGGRRACVARQVPVELCARAVCRVAGYYERHHGLAAERRGGSCTSYDRCDVAGQVYIV